MAEFITILVFLGLCSSAVFAFGPVVRGDRHTRSRRFGLLGPSETSEARSEFSRHLEDVLPAWQLREPEVTSSVVTARIELVARSRRHPGRSIIRHVRAAERETRTYLCMDAPTFPGVWLACRSSDPPAVTADVSEVCLLRGSVPVRLPGGSPSDEEPPMLIASVARTHPAPVLKPLREVDFTTWLPLMSATHATLAPEGVLVPVASLRESDLDTLAAQIHQALERLHRPDSAGIVRAARVARWLSVPLAAGRAGFATDDPWIRSLEAITSGRVPDIDALLATLREIDAGFGERIWCLFSLLDASRARMTVRLHDSVGGVPGPDAPLEWSLARVLDADRRRAVWSRRAAGARVVQRTEPQWEPQLDAERSSIDRAVLAVLGEFRRGAAVGERARGAVSLTASEGGDLSVAEHDPAPQPET